MRVDQPAGIGRYDFCPDFLMYIVIIGLMCRANTSFGWLLIQAILFETQICIHLAAATHALQKVKTHLGRKKKWQDFRCRERDAPLPLEGPPGLRNRLSLPSDVGTTRFRGRDGRVFERG